MLLSLEAYGLGALVREESEDEDIRKQSVLPFSTDRVVKKRKTERKRTIAKIKGRMRRR